MDNSRDLSLVMLLGRVSLMLIFVLSGFGKLMNPAFWMKIMEAQGVPLVHLALPLTILVEFGCALLVVFGLWTRLAAVLMFLWFIPVTIMFHVAPYHAAVLAHNAMAARSQQTNFLKNIAIMGGLLMVAGAGPGRFSIDALRERSGTMPRAA